MNILFKKIEEKGIDGDHLVLFGVMQGNDRDEIERLLKNFISLLLKRLKNNE